MYNKISWWEKFEIIRIIVFTVWQKNLNKIINNLRNYREMIKCTSCVFKISKSILFCNFKKGRIIQWYHQIQSQFLLNKINTIRTKANRNVLAKRYLMKECLHEQFKENFIEIRLIAAVITLRYNTLKEIHFDEKISL